MSERQGSSGSGANVIGIVILLVCLWTAYKVTFGTSSTPKTYDRTDCKWVDNPSDPNKKLLECKISSAVSRFDTTGVGSGAGQ
jgi:Fe2+ transport system protein B